MSRLQELERFYEILQGLEAKLGGTRRLAECDGRMDWPKRGVYFFFEPGEVRAESGPGPRVVRVGTALTKTSRTKLWTRLVTHRGTAKSSGGNHRGSIFRLIVGTALAGRGVTVPASWGEGGSAPAEVRAHERAHERLVSSVIGAMPFVWVDVPDDPSPQSMRGVIERNSIALLSNCDKPPLDPPSEGWLGHHCNRVLVRRSGLWNQNHVEEQYAPGLLDEFQQLCARPSC